MKRMNGSGSVYRLSGNRKRPWTIRITEKIENGKQKYKMLGYYETKEEADIALSEYCEINGKTANVIRDTAKKEKKKPLHGTRLYRIWAGMIQRCENPSSTNYKYYGGKGIKVCEAWRKDFNEFSKWAMASGYTDELTIDRLNPDDDYCPENCWWATWQQQADTKTLNKILKERKARGVM